MLTRSQPEFDLDRIAVAKPCPASWEAMRGDDRARNCGQCGLDVYNIEGLTRSEATHLIANRKGRMCVRMHRRADGMVLTRDCPKGLRAYRLRVAKFAGTVLAAVFGLFSVGYAQRYEDRNSQGIRTETFIDAAMVEGVVHDPNGTPIEGALVTVATATGRKIERRADKKGFFRITDLSLDKGWNIIEISASGFRSFRDEFRIHRRELLSYPVILDIGTFIGVVFISTERDFPIDMGKSSISTTIRVNND